ncbi:hypothetical protein GMRT_16320 [Giardia muris]|uniref:Uncharacterized protein n=1 Tax=Giardia muris TaxID=5742 RepID=A0A4Z1SV19_GIAMU|nr:hypothetical protein GMRT_16320 [Giardia muris]|eukprot:TNJ29666.1 hypothetical protein GMRT_16320 [Giardia muris]
MRAILANFVTDTSQKHGLKTPSPNMDSKDDEVSTPSSIGQKLRPLPPDRQKRAVSASTAKPILLTNRPTTAPVNRPPYSSTRGESSSSSSPTIDISIPILHRLKPREQTTINKQIAGAIARTSSYEPSCGLYLTVYQEANGMMHKVYTKTPVTPIIGRRPTSQSHKSILWFRKQMLGIVQARTEALNDARRIDSKRFAKEDFNYFLYKYIKQKHLVSVDIHRATQDLVTALEDFKDTPEAQTLRILLTPLNNICLELTLLTLFSRHVEKDIDISLHSPQDLALVLASMRTVETPTVLRSYFMTKLEGYKREHAKDTYQDVIEFLSSLDVEFDGLLSGSKRIQKGPTETTKRPPETPPVPLLIEKASPFTITIAPDKHFDMHESSRRVHFSCKVEGIQFPLDLEERRAERVQLPTEGRDSSELLSFFDLMHLN